MLYKICLMFIEELQRMRSNESNNEQYNAALDAAITALSELKKFW